MPIPVPNVNYMLAVLQVVIYFISLLSDKHCGAFYRGVLGTWVLIIIPLHVILSKELSQTRALTRFISRFHTPPPRGNSVA